jgi:long-chain-fatty-acid--[acyl-carrier-protein] ligase
MKFFALVTAAFLGAFGIGYAKFFAYHYLGDFIYEESDKSWIIQVVSALLTIGAVLLYPVSAPLAASYPKRYLMSLCTLLIAVVMTIGAFTNWAGAVWFYLFIVGLLISLFGVSKVALIPIESFESGRKTITVNGIMSIAYVIGMLVGIYVGTDLYNRNMGYGFYFGIFVFVLCSALSLIPSYTAEHTKTYKRSVLLLVEDTLRLSFRFPLYLLTSPLLWGVASAVSLGVTAYVELREISDERGASIITLFAAVGIIIGNAVSPKMANRRYAWSTLTAFLISAFILLGPLAIELSFHKFHNPTVLYPALAFYMVCLGTLFGICSNLIDAEFLQYAAENKREGTGAALQSTALAFFTFVVGGFVGVSIYFELIDVFTQFLILSAISFIAFLLVALLALKNGCLYGVVGRSITYFTKLAIGLRYWIVLKNESIIHERKKGVLLLPNHPAEMDPVIICSKLWLSHRIRPVVTEAFYYMPGVHQILKIMRAFPMPDMEKGCGTMKKKRIDRVLGEIADALRAGDNVLMYPSGHLMRTGREYLGASSGVESILSRYPETEIVLARTRGLWGSSFSTAATEGRTPDLLQALKNAIVILITNLLLFSPRRSVTTEFATPKESLVGKDRLEMNRELEEFYNQEGEEPLTLVPIHFLTRQLTELEYRPVVQEADLSSISEEEILQVLEAFAVFLKMSIKELSPSSKLDEDLGMDSLSRSELIAWLDEEFEVSDVEISELKTVGDVILVACQGAGEQDKSDQDLEVITGWLDAGRPIPSMPEGKNIAQIFLKKADEMGDWPAFADPMIGILSWRKLKLTVLLFANIIKDWPTQRVGILLPASVLTNILVMACWVAKKTPVMLNWTVGRKNLEHAIRVTELGQILTSSRFLDRVDNVDFGECESLLVFVEDIKQQKMGLGEFVVAWWEARKKARRLIVEWGLARVRPEETAVILFTSGSESAPKGVPLTHANLMSNIRGALKILPFHDKSTLYGFLPPFHSFGLTITTVFPMLAGIRTAYHPNPTESRQIARGIARYGITLMCGTPTFVSGIFRAASAESLKSLEFIVTGAEKLPDALADKVMELPNAQILEGYGITECSPVITINYPNEKPSGVGKALPDVELKIVSTDTYECLPNGDRGLICVRGNSVFSGYIGTQSNPFVELDGQAWYNTGDLGYIAEDGGLVLAGRMKRFVKVAGEMISLPAIEDVLNKKWPHEGDGVSCAVQALEKEGERPVFWLFTVHKIQEDEVNEALKAAGFSNLCRIKKVVTLNEIPCLGTGKTNYPALKTMMEEGG